MEKAGRFKILRILNGYTQVGLSECVGTPHTSLVTYEAGKYTPREGVLKSFAEVLQCSPGYLLFGNPVISRAVWKLQPPHRPQHLKNYIKDIESLFPQFCIENGLMVALWFEFPDTNVFVLGTKGMTLDCMLISSDPEVTDSLILAMKKIDVVRMPLIHCAFESGFTWDALEVLTTEKTKQQINIYALQQAYEKYYLKKNSDKIEINRIALNKIFMCFEQELWRYEIPVDTQIEGEIGRFFVEKCSELAPIHESKLKTFQIMREVRKKFETLGCHKKSEASSSGFKE